MPSIIREREVASKQMGRRENKIINVEGRVQFDLLQVLLSCNNCIQAISSFKN